MEHGVDDKHYLSKLKMTKAVNITTVEAEKLFHVTHQKKSITPNNGNPSDKM